MFRDVGKKERILWISLVTVILAGLTFILLDEKREQAAWVREEANLQGRISELTTELTARTEGYARQVMAYPGNNPNIKVALESQGFEGSVLDIIDDLTKHPELIPYEGILGGKMGFYNKDEIYVLTDQWVCANFNDGHISGSLLLRFEVNSGAISWEIIDSRLFY